MASINQVYGDSYHKESVLERAGQAINHIANNLCNNQLRFNLFSETHHIWQGNNIKPEFIPRLINNVKEKNPKMRLLHIDKNSKNINAFPYFKDGPAEYFVLISLETRHLYQLVITPQNVTPY